MTTSMFETQLIYNSDANTRLENLQTAFMEFAENLALIYEELEVNTTSMRVKFIHPKAPNDYMVWYITNLSSSTMSIHIYIDNNKDTNTFTSDNGVNGRFCLINISSWSDSSYVHCIKYVKSKDGNNFAFGYGDNLYYSFILGKDPLNCSLGMYINTNKLIYHNENNSRIEVNIVNPITDKYSIILAKAYCCGKFFIADSAYYPLMSYGISGYYDFNLNGKTYFVTANDNSAYGRIAFEV